MAIIFDFPDISRRYFDKWIPSNPDCTVTAEVQKTETISKVGRLLCTFNFGGKTCAGSCMKIHSGQIKPCDDFGGLPRSQSDPPAGA